MYNIEIEGGLPLVGSTRVQGAKNSVLPIMAAAVLTPDRTVLEDCPLLSDVEHMGEILRRLGCKVERNGRMLVIDPQGMNSHEMPDALAKKIRSSIFLMGPILTRFHKATVTFPGGCEIGLRPIDLHLSGLRQLGVVIHEEGGVIHCDGHHMQAGCVHFDYPSVGATENVMMAAVLLRGRTTLHNVAREPEIVDLQHFLNRMGASISGAGSHTIVIEGVRRLRGISYTPMPDRIVAGTMLAAAAITGGKIQLKNVPAEDMQAVFSKLREMDCVLMRHGDSVNLHAPQRLRPFERLQTQPHPGFPTDMQAQLLALATVASGTSVLVENVFENRYGHAGDLNRMGADVLINGRTAVVKGVGELYGAQVTARDLRGGAALALAGLRAIGETVVEQAHLIDRGYEQFERALASLGAEIRCEKIHDT